MNIQNRPFKLLACHIKYGPSDIHEMTYFMKEMKDIGPSDLCHRAIVSEEVILIPLPVKLITHKQMSRIVKKDDKLTVIC